MCFQVGLGSEGVWLASGCHNTASTSCFREKKGRACGEGGAMKRNWRPPRGVCGRRSTLLLVTFFPCTTPPIALRVCTCACACARVCVCVCDILSRSLFRCMWYLMWCRCVWHQFGRSVPTWTCLASLFPLSQRTQRQTENRGYDHIHMRNAVHCIFIVQDGCSRKRCSWRCLGSIL